MDSMTVVRLKSMTRPTGSQFDWNLTFSFARGETDFTRITASMVGNEPIATEGYHDKIRSARYRWALCSVGN